MGARKAFISQRIEGVGFFLASLAIAAKIAYSFLTSQAKVMWTLERARATFHQPFADLMFQAQTVHRQNFNANTLQVSELLSIKTGGCPEDCSYCSQSAHHGSRPSSSQLMPLAEVKAAAAAAKSRGSSRFCMGAAWRSLSDRDTQAICTMVREVKSLGMETCMTLGMLQAHQARALQEAGLDYYNHNVDTSPEFYGQIISTRTFADRMETLQHVRSAGLKICSGGILGLGESQEDRFAMLLVLANMAKPPESVPINHLVKVEGTPLAESGVAAVDVLDFIRNIALARLMLPNSYIRLSAGREAFSAEAQALCFLAGANSFFYGDKLLTTNNQAPHQDELLLSRLGMKKEPVATTAGSLVK